VASIVANRVTKTLQLPLFLHPKPSMMEFDMDPNFATIVSTIAQ
jgi:hypothetical protein